jgi:hypothetical protein
MQDRERRKLQTGAAHASIVTVDPGARKTVRGAAPRP